MLSANDIALVRASFARVVPIQDAAADLFYDRLFAVSPKLRELFPADLREQKRKLIQMIATAVGGLNDLDKLVPAVKALGAFRRRSHDNTHFERARTRSSAAIRGSGLAPSAGAELSGQGRPARRAAARRRRD